MKYFSFSSYGIFIYPSPKRIQTKSRGNQKKIKKRYDTNIQMLPVSSQIFKKMSIRRIF